MSRRGEFKPALAHRWLTRFYDPVLRLALRRYDLFGRLLRHIELEPGDKVLDLGCGSARLAMTVKSRHPHVHVVGLDADADILQVARHNIREASYDVRLVQAMADATPFADNTFDAVVSSLLFHHLPTATKHRTLREMRRIVKPGGTLYVLDWGPPHPTLTGPRKLLLRIAFLAVQLFDGFATTTDNVRGLLPEFMEKAGFICVVEPECIPTAGGSLSIYKAINPS